MAAMDSDPGAAQGRRDAGGGQQGGELSRRRTNPKDSNCWWLEAPARAAHLPPASLCQQDSQAFIIT